MGGSLTLEWIFIIRKNKKSELMVIIKNQIPITPTLEKKTVQKVSLPEEQHVMCVHTIMDTTTTSCRIVQSQKENFVIREAKMSGSREN
jgi:hypothetical protein